MQADLAVIAAATMGNPAYDVRYANVVKSINNVLKKTQGLLDGFARKDIAAIKDVQDAEFRAWFNKHQAGASKTMLADLDAVIAADMALSEEEYAWSVATHSDLLDSARTLYRLALERQKPDAKRDAGYQERDLSFIKARLTRLEQSLVAERRRSALLGRAAALPEAGRAHASAIARRAAAGAERRAAPCTSRPNWPTPPSAWPGSARMPTPSASRTMRSSSWPSSCNDVATSLENRRKEINGNLEKVIPQYMSAVIAWKKTQGKPVYPDANSTLRVTYGTVAPYSPRDGVVKGPFTTVDGIVEKHTGKDPFIAPKALLDAVKDKRFGVFKDPVLNTVPVNFLSSADTTGGNSGSAVMNKRGELVGLNFDSTYESITKDWYFDSAITRAIHVDIRYMLWVMKEVDHADNLLKEMTIKYPKK